MTPTEATEPEVSVILPTRNRVDLLRRALESVLAQEDVVLEAIVIDDASTDATPAYLDSVSDSRVRVVRQSSRRERAEARNRGIAAARGGWVAFLDDDDRWLPRRLRATLDAALEAGAGYAYGSTAVVDERGRTLKVEPAPSPEEFAAAVWSRSPVWTPSAVIVRTDLLRRVGPFDRDLAPLEDWDLWIRLAGAGRGAPCPEPLVEYTLHSDSTLFDREVDAERALDRLSAKHGGIDRAHFVDYLASRYRSRGLRLRASRLYLREGLRRRKPGHLGRAFGVLLGEGAMRSAAEFRQRARRLRT